MSGHEEQSTFRRWSDVVGHRETIDAFARATAQSRLHHANLLVGPAGIGKRQLAFALATQLHCVAVSEDGEACGDCTQCRLHIRGEHPDFVLLAPEGRFIKIDAVREMQKQTRFRPYSAKRRVVVIDDAETLREEAANALLKTLEEPGGETLFLLLAAEANRLLPTIRSRCQPIRCAPLTLDETRAVLARESVDVDETVARLSYGSPGRAIALGQSGVLGERRSLVDGLLSLADRDASMPIRVAEQWATSRDEVDARYEALIWIARDVVLAAVDEHERIANRDLLSEISECAAIVGSVRGAQLCDMIESSRLRFLGNGNPRMLFESLLIETQNLMLKGAADA